MIGKRKRQGKEEERKRKRKGKGLGRGKEKERKRRRRGKEMKRKWKGTEKEKKRKGRGKGEKRKGVRTEEGKKRQGKRNNIFVVWSGGAFWTNGYRQCIDKGIANLASCMYVTLCKPISYEDSMHNYRYCFLGGPYRYRAVCAFSRHRRTLCTKVVHQSFGRTTHTHIYIYIYLSLSLFDLRACGIVVETMTFRDNQEDWRHLRLESAILSGSNRSVIRCIYIYIHTHNYIYIYI